MQLPATTSGNPPEYNAIQHALFGAILACRLTRSADLNQNEGYCVADGLGTEQRAQT